MATYIVNPTEEQEKALEAFLEGLDVFYIMHDDNHEELPPHVIAGIKAGEEDFEAGRTISMEEFKKNFRAVK
ncbi:hypothetical protein [Mucilaginibacter psychrotolerans]|uniref:Uncharacterized protein n=1 Tax=Mucilaginibacter psychrotolerans TaxID=1524096 RepID=A0A4Y8S4F9_9SPHI|nr:hypothetical protein [Mucilaginibacter psychrotolerans]TFF33812.1 hypothetical protein E2R66_24075 [Mucilaginibacter psychrotolerans]